MKTIAIIVAGLTLAACSQATSELDAAIKRSDVVKVCEGGALIGMDPKTKGYVLFVPGDFWTGSVKANIGAGVTPDQVCAGR